MELWRKMEQIASEEQSLERDMTWDIAKARDIMNNMFNKEKIRKLTLNA